MVGVETALVIGAIPTFTMVLAILILTNVEVGPKTEASVQNFAAGLILAAVAGELFPVLLDNKDGPSLVGSSIGFVVAMSAIYGLEHLVSYIERIPEVGHDTDANGEHARILSFPEGMDGEGVELHSYDPHIDDSHATRASEALAMPEHRGHIRAHLQELMACIAVMDAKSSELAQGNISMRQKEAVAESIDEMVHSLQYKLDHCRRLLHGSEVTDTGELQAQPASSALNELGLVLEDKQSRLSHGIAGLKLMAEHLLSHIQEPHITNGVLKEMHLHMDYMNRQIETFHEQVERVGSKFHHAHELPRTEEGDRLPLSLIIPVSMDCFVDGFLIGISAAISLKAGIVLGFANSLEMAFLGMAYGARLAKCTGSPFLTRQLALYGPPLLMFLSAGLGALVGDAVASLQVVYIALVAFGAVALLFLVCNELLIEAHNAQGDDERWWISALVFLGIYAVLVLDHLL